jgi:hypothetical protein
MYAVVGCSDCGAVWLLSDPGESDSATCPRCETRHRTRKLRRFAETGDREEARQLRAAMLARKRGESEAFAEVDHAAELADRAEDAGVDDREYLERSGVDPDAVEAAGEAARRGESGSRSRREVVLDGVEAAAEPTEEAVVAYASERGVPPDAARELLAKLTRRGTLSESRGRYRRL